MRQLLLFVVMIVAVVSVRAQDAPAAVTAPSTTPASGTQASSGAPTITNPAPAPGQPVAFSHKKHVGQVKLACDACHEPSRNGSTVAIPQPPKCMTCHAAVATDKPDIKRLADAAQNNQLLQWVRVYRLPSFVTFSHKTHTTAGAQCQDCHGPVAEREAIALEKDISMGGCISCHQQKAAPTTCDTCHQLNSVHLQDPTAAFDSALIARLTPTKSAKPRTSTHPFMAMLRLKYSVGAPRPSN